MLILNFIISKISIRFFCFW